MARRNNATGKDAQPKTETPKPKSLEAPKCDLVISKESFEAGLSGNAQYRALFANKDLKVKDMTIKNGQFVWECQEPKKNGISRLHVPVTISGESKTALVNNAKLSAPLIRAIISDINGGILEPVADFDEQFGNMVGGIVKLLPEYSGYHLAKGEYVSGRSDSGKYAKYSLTFLVTGSPSPYFSIGSKNLKLEGVLRKSVLGESVIAMENLIKLQSSKA